MKPLYDLDVHKERVEALHRAYPLKTTEACADHIIALVKRLNAPDDLEEGIADVVQDMLACNRYLMPSLPGAHHRTSYEEAEAIYNPARLHAATETLVRIFTTFLQKHTPPLGEGILTVPLIELVRDYRTCVQEVFTEITQSGLFPDTTRTLSNNLIVASGLMPDRLTQHPRFKYPKDSDLPPGELVSAYLRGSPWSKFLKWYYPYAIDRRAFGEHGITFGPAGHGKTSLLAVLLVQFLAEPDPPGLWIIDSHGDLLREVEQLACFDPEKGRLRDRLVIIDPEDCDDEGKPTPPALNFFQLTDDLSRYSYVHQQSIKAGIDELFRYLFRALSAELTAAQSVTTNFVTALISAIPNATILDLLKMMEDPAKSVEKSIYYEYIQKLDEVAQNFFKHQFFGGNMNVTRQGVARRLYQLIQSPVFLNMFSAPQNRFSVSQAIAQKKVCLINTSRMMLRDSSSIFGRYWLSRILAAAFERVTIPPKDRHLCMVFADEAHQYMDESATAILSEARKYGVGLFLLTQNLDQIKAEVRASVMGNTAIRMAGPVSVADAKTLAAEMNTTPEFIRSCEKDTKGAEFAVHVRGGPTVKTRIPFGVLSMAPKMTAEAHRALRMINRARYATVPAVEAPSEAKTPPPKVSQPEPSQTVPPPPTPEVVTTSSTDTFD